MLEVLHIHRQLGELAEQWTGWSQEGHIRQSQEGRSHQTRWEELAERWTG
jgi:hypothetical protein